MTRSFSDIYKLSEYVHKYVRHAAINVECNANVKVKQATIDIYRWPC